MSQEDPPSSTFEEAVSAWLAGELPTIDLYDSMLRYGYCIALRNVSDRDEAEDVTQVAVWKASLSIHTFRGNDVRSFKSWFRRIVQNRAVDSLRKRNRGEFVSLEEAENLPAPETGQPENECEKSEFKAVLEQELSLLSQAVVDGYLNNQKPNKIAEELGLKRSQVYSRWQSALAKLKNRLF